MIVNAKIIAVDADPNAYHKQRGLPGSGAFAMSASALREFARCPQRWRNGYSLPDAECRKFGGLLDCRLLTPGQFDARYAVKPKEYTNPKGETKRWNGNSNTCREWLEEHAHQEVVSIDEIHEADEACKSLLSDEVATAYLTASERQVWVAADWQDKPTGVVVPVKCLIDLVPKADTEFSHTLGDLKTDSNGSVQAWQRKCFAYGYHLQAAWNLALYNAATQGERDRFCFLIVENYPPWQPAKRMLHADFLEFAHMKVNRLMSSYCGCVKSGNWPGYDDTDEAVQGWSVVNAEPWMQSADMFSPKFDFLPECEEANDPDWIKEPQTP